MATWSISVSNMAKDYGVGNRTAQPQPENPPTTERI
jgi:hypothetical protein